MNGQCRGGSDPCSRRSKSNWSPWPSSNVGAVAIYLTAIACQVNAADLQRSLAPLIDSHRGDVAVYVKHFGSGKTFSHRADVVMPTASMIKAAVMVEAFRQAEAGTISLDDRTTLREEDKVPGSGVLTDHFSEGATFSLRDAIRLMIVFSDNTATNLVLDQIGLASTSETMQSLKLPNTRIHAKVFRRDTSIAPERSKKYGLGSTTAAEMASLFEQLHAGKLANDKASGEMLQLLRACEDRTKLARLLPSSVKIAHKGGSVSRSRCDAALIESPNGAIVVCVMTNNNQDRSWGPDNKADLLCSQIGKVVYDHFNPADSPVAEDEPLKMGASGELVEALQRTLNARLKPSPDLSVDGDFGPATRDAVVRFQKSMSLKASGAVSSETWRALGTLVMKDPPVADPAVVNSQKLPLQPADAPGGPPFVTCKAWALGDPDTGKLLGGHDESRRLDIASTTKIMTAYVILSIADREPAVLREIVNVSKRADRTIGSTAGVRTGEKVPVAELLYGLLLPSGNDASVALAEHFGAKLASKTEDSENRAGKERPANSDPLDRFVAEMNRQAQRLEMNETRFINPHGLTAEGHQSSARDLLRLATAALKLPKFAEYVGTRQRGATIEGPGGYRRNVVWKNTNRLLGTEEYFGVKTGTTGAAGACLVSGAKRDGRRLILVVLGASSSNARYVDSRNLYRWAWGQPEKKAAKVAR